MAFEDRSEPRIAVVVPDKPAPPPPQPAAVGGPRPQTGPSQVHPGRVALPAEPPPKPATVTVDPVPQRHQKPAPPEAPVESSGQVTTRLLGSARSGGHDLSAQAYSAPIAPDPPALPGILDRGPPRSDGSFPRGGVANQGRQQPRRAPLPDYLDDNTNSSPRFDPNEWSARRDRALSGRVEPERAGPPDELLKVVGALGIVIFSVGLILICLTVLFTRATTEDEGLMSSREPVADGIDIRPSVQDDGTDQPSEGAGPSAVAPRAPVVEEAPEPPPVVKPPPTPRPRPSPAVGSSVLKIRSNRKALVFVNGKAIGYTPKDYPVPPGSYQISAMIPGQAATKQTQSTALQADDATKIRFSF